MIWNVVFAPVAIGVFTWLNIAGADLLPLHPMLVTAIFLIFATGGVLIAWRALK